ncbi:PIN domain-containing protein [Thermococcus sp. 9N3]|nr:PIN domain-containing protein [Thermococcus sp. 9N3]
MSRSEIGEKYQLLPNDTLIVATCAEHEIERILTFDSDFEKVPLVKVVR